MSRGLIVQPDEVRTFVRELRNYTNKLEADTSRILERLSTLGETWRDRKYDKFREDMKDVAKEVKKARTAGEIYAKHLSKFADDADVALGRKI